jgi:hypothetical protein
MLPNGAKYSCSSTKSKESSEEVSELSVPNVSKNPYNRTKSKKPSKEVSELPQHLLLLSTYATDASRK